MSKEHEADNILVYMNRMLEKARAADVSVRRANIQAYGKTLPLFKGVEGWFDRIDRYGKDHGVRTEHYVISSGLREMIEGSPIAKKFAKIFASSFMYTVDGIAQWPALAVNYTTKTQYLFRINKGSLDVYDHSKINEYVPMDERPVLLRIWSLSGTGRRIFLVFGL